ncbi:tyrosine-type recombinase/integrase [Gabonibacter sp. KD22]|nr:tyrosine-type recombinase/integrase [Gabonibacter chumensis]MCR9011637.1 tyrosine-type recombinase/integrase [Gabonibacter chumensis]
MQLQAFLNYLSRVKRYSPRTIKAYQMDLRQFFDYCKLSDSEEDILKITTKLVRGWLMAEMSGSMRKVETGEKLKGTSGKRKLSSLKAFFRFLLKEGVLEVNPAEGISGPKTAKRLPVFVKEEEMAAVLNVEKEDFPCLRDWLILLMAYDTGMRRSEIVGLKVSDVDFSRRCIRVTGKGNKQREIPVVNELEKAMAYYLERRQEVVIQEHGFFFVTDKGLPVYDKFVYRLVTEKLSKNTTLSKRSPHVLRHSFATHLLNNGASIEGIRELLGHSSLAATQVYTHNSVESMLKIFKQAHPRA